MKHTVLAICDDELDYAAHLADYLGRKESGFSEIRVFTGTEKLKQYLGHHRISMLLIGEILYTHEQKCENDFFHIISEKVDELIVLSEGMAVAEDYADCTYVYKFQSAEHIRRELQELYAIQKGPEKRESSVGSSCIFGVFSPCGGSHKTMFSVGLGEILAKQKKVLYLNLECFPGIDRQIYENHIEGLSELFYYIREKNIALSEKIQSMVCTMGNIDTIPTVSHFRDLMEITENDVAVLMGELKVSGIYDYIILDLGYFCGSTFEWLSWCDAVFLTGGEDKISTEKKKTLRHYMQMEGRGDLWERFYGISVPKVRNLDEAVLQELIAGGNIEKLVQEIKNEIQGKKVCYGARGAAAAVPYS